LVRLSGLDLLAMQNEHGLAVTEQSHGRRRWQMTWKQIAKRLNSF